MIKKQNKEQIEKELKKIEDSSRPLGLPLIRTESHKILEEYITEYQPKNVLEIGTAVGFSAITILSASNGSKLYTIEHEKSLVKLAKKNLRTAKLLKRTKVVKADCMVELAKMVASGKYDGYFDFVFLDGPKGQYGAMLELLLILMKSGGVLLADNVLFRGIVIGEKTAPTKRYKTIQKRLEEFIKNCKNHPKLCEFKLIDTEDGIIFAKKV